VEVNLDFIRKVNLGVRRHVVGMSPTEDSLATLDLCSDPELSTSMVNSNEESLESSSDPMSTALSFELRSDSELLPRRGTAGFREKTLKSEEDRVFNGLKALGVWGFEESQFSG
jgi:hypothetical protein